MYTNLHVHSEHSLLDGAAKISSLAETAASMGHKYLALTDHGSMCGAVSHNKACLKNNIKPLFGIELFLIEHFKDLEKTKQQNLHLTAIAKNQRGFELLLKSQGYANQYGSGKSGRFRRPFLPIRYPIENDWKDNVVILSGCSSSPFWGNLKDSDGVDLFSEYCDYFGKDIYGEVMPLHDWDVQQGVNTLVYEASKAKNIKLVTTNDIHYCRKEDWKLHELIICMSQHGMTWNNPNRWQFSTHNNYFRTAEDMIASITKMGFGSQIAEESILNTNEVAEKCSFKLEKYPLDLPSPLAAVGDEEEYFMAECADGMKSRGLEGDTYWARLEKEIEVLREKGFVRYMLIVADLIRWAKYNGVFIGPARGSSAGSLVCYVLGITDIDPIKHGLIFERFIAPDRNDLPDVDIDIEDRRRQAVEEYLKSKYGSDNVAHLSTFQELLGRSALRDVAKIFEVPPVEIDQASKCIIKRLDSDARAYNTIEDTINESQEFRTFNDKYPEIVNSASKLEGQIRGVGVHAAGYVLSNSKLNETNRCYLVKGNSGISAVNWDKDDLEFFGFVKIDLLGLATHSVISGCLELIAKSGTKLDMSKIPLDDQKVIDSIGRGETATVFQLSTTGLTRYCKDLKPQNFEDIAATTALWRPGPIEAGMAHDYIEVRHGRLEPVYLCKEHCEIAEPTKGQLIYQEQITELLIKLSGMSYSRADSVRKVMGKRLGAGKWQEYELEFIKGCLEKKTLNEIQAKSLWERLGGFATYAFNKSHAVAYGLISYWTAYLKFYYPTEYLCSYLNFGSTDKENKDGEANLDIALTEAQRLGISILCPSVRDSLDNWTMVTGQKGLRAGLKEIRNIGPAAKEELTRLKSSFRGGFQSIEHFQSLAEKRKLNIRCVKSLVASGAFDDMPDVQAFRDKLGLAGSQEERDQYLNYNEAKLLSRDVIIKDIGEFLDADVDGDRVLIGDTLVSYEDVLAGKFPKLQKGLIQEIKVKNFQSIRTETTDCTLCDLRKGCTKPVPAEKGKLNLMIVAEAPGFHEDKRSRPLIGKPGSLLFSCLEDLGLPREYFFIDNVLHCRPPEGTKPESNMIDGCPHLDKAIEAVQPKIILSLGNSALYKFIGKQSGIMSYAGTAQWSPKYKCYVVFGVHPSYASRDDGDNEGRMKLFRSGLVEFQRMVTLLLGNN